MKNFIRLQTSPNVITFLVNKDEMKKAIEHPSVLVAYSVLEIRLNNKMRIIWDNHFIQKSFTHLSLGQSN